jgi:hypothetical protein
MAYSKLYWLSVALVVIITASLIFRAFEPFDQSLSYVTTVTSQQNINKNITGSFNGSCSSCGLALNGSNYAISCKCKDKSGKLQNANITYPTSNTNPNIANCNGNLALNGCPTSCYGAKPVNDCNTCQKVKDAYKAKNWAVNANLIDQCKFGM